MAHSHSQSITIDAPPEELFDIVTDLLEYPDWLEGFEEVEIFEETEDGFPARARMTVDAKIRTITYTLDYEYDYPHVVSWTNIPEESDVKELNGSYRFTPQGDSTLVEYELSIDPGFRVPGFLLKQAQRAIMGAALKGLKEKAEA